MNLLLGLAVILIGAELFTNGVEWLGAKLGLSEGAVGSILAAVGTALPESIIPIVAILFSGDIDTSHIGIGAILGAPFMLGTLAFFITGLSARCFIWRGPAVYNLNVDVGVIKRDLIFFVVLYTIAISASLSTNIVIHYAIAGLLVLAYIFYVFLTLKSGKEVNSEDLKPLFLFFRGNPPLWIVLAQIAAALTAIILGANYFVGGIEALAQSLGIPSLILALIIAPIATELPEKFNSIIWIAQRKDTLAMGNITGAMVFQSSLIPAFGIIATPWQLNGISLLSGILVLLSALFITLTIIIKNKLNSAFLMLSGLFYLVFMLVIYWGVKL